MGKVTVEKMRLWKNVVGILDIVLGMGIIAFWCIMWFYIFPGELAEHPYMWMFALTLIGGIGAIIMGALLLVLTPRVEVKEEAKPVEEFEEFTEAKEVAKKTYRLKCKSCGQMFKVPDVSGPIKCPFCEATGKIR